MQTIPITPQFKGKARTQPITTVVLHATAGSTLDGAVKTLHDKGLGYHYLISKTGDVYKGCATSRNCGHAGKSVGPDGPGVNDYGIGTSYVHPNNGSAISEAAIAASIELLTALKAAIPTLRYVTTHYAITVQPNGRYRKSDPRNCPLELIAEKTGLTPWKPSYATRYSL